MKNTNKKDMLNENKNQKHTVGFIQKVESDRFWLLTLIGENTYRQLFHCICGGRIPKSYLMVKLHQKS